MKTLYIFLATCSLTCFGALETVEKIAWLCDDPNNGCWALVLMRYTQDTNTGQIHGNYKEWWIDVESEPTFLRMECTYNQGIKDGEEVVFPDPSQPLTEIHNVWDMGQLTYKRQVRYDHESNKESDHESSYIFSGEQSIAIYFHTISYYDSGQEREETLSGQGRGMIFRRWFSNGQMEIQQEFNDLGQQHGRQILWDEDGDLRYVRPYVNGLRHGVWESWSNGKLMGEDEYNMGISHGINNSYWYSSGQLSSMSVGTDCNGKRSGIHTITRYSDGVVMEVTTNDYGECEELALQADDFLLEEPEVKWLEGMVFDKTLRTPLSGVTVAVQGGVNTTTDETGHFLLELGTNNLYQLSFTHPDYLTREGDLNVSAYQKRTITVGLVALGNDSRPEVLSLSSPAGAIFFEGLTSSIPFTADISWADLDPDQIVFQLNGQPIGQGSESSITIPASQLTVSNDKTANTITAIATNTSGLSSVPFNANPVLAPLPKWLTSLGTLAPSSGSYTLSREWPSEPLNLQINQQNLGSYAWQAWQLMPLIGGQAFGLQSTQAMMNLNLKTDGNGSLLLGGQTGLVAGGSQITGKVGGRGKFYYSWGTGLEWKGGSLVLGLAGDIKKEVGIVEMIPALGNAVNLPVVGSSIAWVNNKVKVVGNIGMSMDMEFALIDKDYGLDFSQTDGTLSTSLKLGLEGGQGSVKLALTGQGEARAVFQVPANPDYLKTVEVELGASLEVTAWMYQNTFTASHTFSYPSSTSASAYALSSPTRFHPIARDFLSNPQYHKFPAPSYRNLSSSPVPTWIELIENIYPLTDLSISTSQAIAYVYFDPAKETLQATEIHVLDTSATDTAVTSDTQVDLEPDIWNMQVAWTRVKTVDFPSTGSLSDMAAAMEIAYMTNYSSGTLAYMTDNDYLDFAPKWASDVYETNSALFWQSNPGNHVVGTAAFPTEVYWARFEPSMQEAELVGSYVAATAFHYAASSTEYAMTWLQDMDGNLATEDNQVLAKVTTDGVWGPDFQVSSGGGSKQFPHVFFASDGVHFVWAEGDTLKTQDPSGTTTDLTQFEDTIVGMHMGRNMELPEWTIQTRDGQVDTMQYIAEWGYPVPTNVPTEDVLILAASRLSKGLYILGLQHTDAGENLVRAYTTQYNTDRTLSIESDLTSSVPVPGQVYPITIGVRNTGRDALGSSFVSLNTKSNAPLQTVAIPALAGGEYDEVTLEWTAPVANWPQGLKIGISNDQGTPVNIWEGLNLQIPYCDLQIDEVTITDGPSGSWILSATIRNMGPYAATGIRLSVLEGPTVVQSQVVAGLHPGKQAEVALNIWPMMDLTNATPLLKISVDPENSISESNENNNTIYHKVTGNGDLWASIPEINGYKHADWFGWFVAFDSGFIYHNDLGWLYADGESLASIYLYDPIQNIWLWTSQTDYPFMYNYSQSDWCFYMSVLKDSNRARWNSFE